ncbi:MAG: thiamine diphosphokinase [Dysgonamonadaceae bacterium]|jgi:thiamine pyrophosphokinase|nr:thiamine diphosphokinase [Dysgonamonadaceae bacterium]
MTPLLQDFKTIILANGAFPQHKVPLSFLHSADRIICCDGAIINLLQIGLEPNYIVGDLDSIPEGLKKRFSSILYQNSEQETNDLTKSVRFCVEHNWNEITILGATGKREDHSMGNLSLLTDYMDEVDVQLLTDYGVFNPQKKNVVYESYPKQQVSVFSLTPSTRFSGENLIYPLDNRTFTSWWQGTLNESSGDWFRIQMDEGKALVFRQYLSTR